MITVFRWLAVLLWAGGVIAAIFLARIPDRYGGQQFNFLSFLLFLVAFSISGCMMMAISEGLRYLAQISENTRSMRVTLRKEE